MTLVLAASRWRTNAELIADCAALGYLRSEWHTLDPTYGRGVWWKCWRPDHLSTHTRAVDGSDFRHLAYANSTFAAIAFDPPYVSQGGRRTTTVPDFHDRFGLSDAPRTPLLLQGLIDDGLTEMHRLVVPGGNVIVKCKDYVSSGRLWLGTHHTLTHALELGFEVIDRFEHVSAAPGPQSQLKQVHARRNLSTLFVLRKQRTRL